MRSEAEADRKNDANECIVPSGEQEVSVDQWRFVRPDNEIIRTLKKLAMGMRGAIELEIRKTEKVLKGVKKTYYGG